LKFSDIKPFVRYSRTLHITQNSFFDKFFPVDARLFYVKKGNFNIEIEDELFELKKGGIAFINAGVCYKLLPSEVTVSAVNFDFTMHFFKMNSPIPPITYNTETIYKPLEKIVFEDAVLYNNFFIQNKGLSLESKFLELEEEYNKKSPFYTMKNTACLIEILIELLRRNEQQFSNNTRFNPEKTAEYIQAHLLEKIDNSVLGEVFHFHPNYISNEFAKYFGKPIHKYLLEQRILRAVALLEAGDSSINEIALKVGFSDANYFSRYFKKTMGISPLKYIRNKSVNEQ